MRLGALQASIEAGESEQVSRLIDQRLNGLGDVYGSWEDISTVDRRYSPEQIGGFVLPFTLLEADEVEIITANPSEALLDEVMGSGEVRYYWHPENEAAAAKYRKMGEIPVTATSSTRTVMTLGHDPNYMVKLSLPKTHFFYDRTIDERSARYSVVVSNEIEGMGLPDRIAYQAESLAVLHEGEGLIFREYAPLPRIAEERLLVPGFSLSARDRNSPEDPSLVSDIVAHNGGHDKIGYFVDTFIGPLQDSWLRLLGERGLLLDQHGQNCNFELKQDGSIERLVIKDFQSVYVDAGKRSELGLPDIWDDHFPDEQRSAQYSVSYDHMMGIMFMEPLTRALVATFPEFTVEAIQKEAARRFKAQAGDIAEVMPRTMYRLRGGSTGANGGVATIDTNLPPAFR